MLELVDIKKDYKMGDTTVEALRGVSLGFRKNEFVAVLGQSGCGKTTLLNIIGGLDSYTSGDLIINGRSTKEFKSRDWDSYRNHSIGFVFQSYNLISHQTVLANTELALTLNGVSKPERRARAKAALERVGLGDQLKKKPNQMSGGQMQRVAIARALINNPDILLADEPTGALDSETSVQVMEILKEISRDKLVIMVTHNPELAKIYADRIVQLSDGRIISDTNPFNGQENNEPKKKEKVKKPSMSFFTALSLSKNNLLTKKARTFLTSFAGSIGIIGIALVLSISSGFQAYIDRVQEDTLSSYPISISSSSVDVSSMMTSMMNVQTKSEHDLDRVYTSNIMQDMSNKMLNEIKENDLKSFKEFIESKDSGIADYVSDIKYGYNISFDIYSPDTENGINRVYPNIVMDSMNSQTSGDMRNNMMSSIGADTSSSEIWKELIGNAELLDSQYDVIAGDWPKSYNEVVLIVNDNNEISDITMYSLGLKTEAEYKDMMSKIMNGETVESDISSYSYEDILNLHFKLVLKTDFYSKDSSTGLWKNMSDDDGFVANAVRNGTDINVVGILRPKSDSVTRENTGSIGYTAALTEYYINSVNDTEIAREQLASTDRSVITGLPFINDAETEPVFTIEDVRAYLAELPEQQRNQVEAMIATMPEEQVIASFAEKIKSEAREDSFESTKEELGIVKLDIPSIISIYPKDFDSKDRISEIIDGYNERMKSEGNEAKEIQYTDFIGLLLSSVSTIIDVIAYVLIAFVAISLVVSSIMIGVITYISVLERTKEIGILRALGASKHDISMVFNAETLIVGFVSGALGILITLLLTLPVNALVEAATGITNVAVLPLGGAVILVAVSMFMTFIAGLIPSRIAAKKDPVVALRTE
ncbi:MAG: ABC transporter ATP-binding protein/permease [Firmicutes bacterium]|nr:ABC transporter ATP-binding protein/permease [Bacillota bacterium]